MTVKLNGEDYRRLVDILKGRPQFNFARDRYQLVLEALGNEDRVQSILSSIDFEGAKGTVAGQVVDNLSRYGQPEPEYEALGMLIQQVLTIMGDGDEADYLVELLDKYNMLPPPPVPDVTAPQTLDQDATADKYIFISYAHADKAVADIVYDYLAVAGFRLFRDVVDIQGGDNWDLKIEQALEETTHMVLLMSHTSMPYRREVYREWFYYIQEDKPLFPLRITGCKLPSRFRSISYIDATKDFNGALAQLVNALSA